MAYVKGSGWADTILKLHRESMQADFSRSIRISLDPFKCVCMECGAKFKPFLTQIECVESLAPCPECMQYVHVVRV